MTKDTGGSAFPWTEKNHDGTPYDQYEGMTLRDWFAGKALGGWLASYGEQQEHPAEKMDSDTAPYCEMIARYSYRIADAMIKEGNKP